MGLSRREWLVVGAVVASTFVLRVWGISSRFWLLHDQIRDWGFALGSFSDLPLVGPPTHVRGYTIGPAFYWILWLIRVTVGPFFENLPHAGGIGEAFLHSAADALLTIAVWRRVGNLAAALATTVLVATAAYDLCFAALVWNPPMGTTLAKVGMALVLLDWHRQSPIRCAAIAAAAWAAVHAYTGAVFVTLAILLAALIDPWLRRERSIALRNLATITVVVALLQVPYLLFQVKTGFSQPAMGAVTGSLTKVATGGGATQFATSLDTYVRAVAFVQAGPWQAPWMIWLLAAAALVVLVRYRRDSVVLLLTIAPPLGAIGGYALFQSTLDFYYYLSLMPSAVLTVVLAATAVPWLQARRAISVGLAIAAVALVPARVLHSATFHRLPEYGAIVQASRVIAQRGVPMRAIRTDFALPPTCDPEFVYGIFGGTIDRRAMWTATIDARGNVSYQAVTPQS